MLKRDRGVVEEPFQQIFTRDWEAELRSHFVVRTREALSISIPWGLPARLPKSQAPKQKFTAVRFSTPRRSPLVPRSSGWAQWGKNRSSSSGMVIRLHSCVSSTVVPHAVESRSTRTTSSLSVSGVVPRATISKLSHCRRQAANRERFSGTVCRKEIQLGGGPNPLVHNRSACLPGRLPRTSF